MKTILVKDVYRLHGTASISVPEDVTPEYVISYLGQEPRYSAVFLVNSDQQLSGIISGNDLVKWVDFLLFSGKGEKETGESELYRIVSAGKVKDLVRSDYRSLAVKEDDTLQTAFEKMINLKESILPVIDSNGRILGDLRLSEVLLKALEVGRSASSSSPLTLNVDESYNGKEVKLAHGGLLQLALISNPTTGFRWEISHYSDATVLEKLGNTFQTPGLKPPEGAHPPLGAGGKELWSFRAQKRGKSILSMEYSRPWERGEKGANKFSLTVIVE